MTANDMNAFKIVESTLSKAVPHESADWVLTTALVADGYGCNGATIRGHKMDHADEIKEGVHWVKNPQGHTLWTKQGVIRLGMFVKTEQGRLFRDHAERLVMDSGRVGNRNAPELSVGNRYAEAQNPLPATVPENGSSVGHSLEIAAERVADVIVGQLSAEDLFKGRVNHHVKVKLDGKLPLVDPDSLGKQFAAQWGLEQVVELTATIAMLTGAAKCSG
jgi:hypothetical protein